MSEARTTVVIATHNRAAELDRTLRELAALRPPPPVVVVDNASGDGTAEMVQAAHPDVRLIPLPRNIGATARNFGVAAASTPYVAFSDDDSWWAPGALTRAESILDERPRVALIAARTLVGKENREDPINQAMAASPLGSHDGLPVILGFLACAAVFRAQAYLDCGGFHPMLHFGAEEKLLALDLSAQGWQLCYAEEVVAHHHPSPSRLPAARRRRLELRNNLLITWMRRTPAACAAAAGRTALAVLRDPRSVLAVAGAVRRLPRAIAQRSPLPREVERRMRTLERDR